MDIMKLTHRQVIDTLDAEYWQSFCIRWPHLDRERTMTDAEIIEQGHRIELRKTLLWQGKIMCERCAKCLAINTERYCKNCKQEVVEELEDCGYLQPVVPFNIEMRGADAKEDISETKFGLDDGGSRHESY